MVAAAQAVVVIPAISGIARDAVVNTFNFALDAYADMTAVDTALGPDVVDFYTHTNTSYKVGEYLGYSRDRTADVCLVKWYDLDGHLDGSPHGSPAITRTFSLPAPNSAIGGIMPTEVCAVLSVHSAYGSDPEFSGATRPRARDRGRVYVGPLVPAAMGLVTTILDTELTTSFRTDLTVAAARLITASTGHAVDAEWAVWSRTRAALTAITGGWVDNAPDTQRRRGSRPTVRTTF
jgi:hypothetical protein